MLITSLYFPDALRPLKLKLVGPFDVLAGNVNNVYEEDLPDLLRHWRFYYDPPEFQVTSLYITTVLQQSYNQYYSTTRCNKITYLVLDLSCSK